MAGDRSNDDGREREEVHDENAGGERVEERDGGAQRDGEAQREGDRHDRVERGDGERVDGEPDDRTQPRVPGCGPDCSCHPQPDGVADARDDSAGDADDAFDVRDVVAPDGGVESDEPSSPLAEPDPEGGHDVGYDPVDVFAEPAEMDLRPGADNCYKCSVCDTNCPVAEVDDEFPGPKFQGPEQWRLRRAEREEPSGGRDADDRTDVVNPETIDPSIEKCSSCMRCDHACPTDVPLAQMHNTARAKYVENQVPKLSRNYLRRKVLSNYGRLAKLASYVPRLANFVLGLTITKWVNEKLLMVASERDFPAFATQTFRDWWAERGGAQVQSEEKRVAYFHGDYANYNTPEVGKALVRLYEQFGYEVAVPPQRCSGTPMLANGMLDDARNAAETNVSELGALIEEGYDVVSNCTSCTMSLRMEYPELFDLDGVDDVSAHTYEAVEYLRIHEDLRGALEATDVDWPDLAYHAPCHGRNQGIAQQSLEVGDALDGVDVHDVGESCSGISGTWGWKREHYDNSMAIGEEMFEHMEDADAEVGLTECPTCAMQMEHGTGYDVKHPLQLLEAALVDGEHAGGDASGYE